MLKFMLFNKNHKMPLVGCGLAVDLVRRDLARVRARISQQGPGLCPNNSSGGSGTRLHLRVSSCCGT